MSGLSWNASPTIDADSHVPDEHERIWVTVNAPVDAGARPLADALSAFRRLRVFDGQVGATPDGAHLLFRYGEENRWGDLASFVLGWFGPNLLQTVGTVVDLSLRPNRSPVESYASLYVRRGAWSEVAAAIRALATEFNET